MSRQYERPAKRPRRDRKRAHKAKPKAQDPRPPPTPPVTSPPSDTGRCVADCARGKLGSPYRWGTAGPNTFDCSGLAAFCYQQCTGRAISRSSYEQIGLGQAVRGDDAFRPGDLLFWDTEGNGTAGHTGIYVGDGQVVSALNETRGTVLHGVGAPMGGPFLGGRRLG